MIVLRRVLLRLLAGVAVLWGAATLTFVGLNVTGGDPALAILGGPDAMPTAEALAQVRREYGLDQPLAVQYASYLGRLAQGDLGESYRLRIPVTRAIGEHIGATVWLAAGGAPGGPLPPTAFVLFLQNHDQVGNRAFGERLAALADEDALKAATLLLLLSPMVPLLFMGEEWGSTRPFLFFTDHQGELADAVREGRRHEFAEFSRFSDPQLLLDIPDPNAQDTFDASRPDLAPADQPRQRAWLSFYRRLLRLRQSQLVPVLEGTRALGVEVLARGALSAGWRLGDGRLLPPQEAWARDLGKSNIAQLTAYLETAQPIAALTSTQTQGKPPALATGNAQLSPEELAVCTAMGMTPEQYKGGAKAAAA